MDTNMSSFFSVQTKECSNAKLTKTTTSASWAKRVCKRQVRYYSAGSICTVELRAYCKATDTRTHGHSVRTYESTTLYVRTRVQKLSRLQPTCDGDIEAGLIDAVVAPLGQNLAAVIVQRSVQVVLQG